MYRLDNPIRRYAWGSHRVLAELLGRPSPSADPEAELWMGAHPSDPSHCTIAGQTRSLVDWIAAHPRWMLGDACLARWGQELPFLLKVLAVEEPLSLQAHPSRTQAEAGYARETAEGISLGDPSRDYKDAAHKPELLCALTPFMALCGFRDIQETRALLRQLAIPSLGDAAERLPDAAALETLVGDILRTPSPAREQLVAETVEACQRLLDSASEPSPFARSCEVAIMLAQRYPGDTGVLTSLLLNLIELQPGEAIYVPDGKLHAYLAGVGVEIMANSDNVLRGGLTPKHLNVPELLRILAFDAGPADEITPTPRSDGERVYETPAEEFRLARLDLEDGVEWEATSDGPEILFCTDGTPTVEILAHADPPAGADGPLAPTPGPQPMHPGQARFCPAGVTRYRLLGTGTIFRATLGGAARSNIRRSSTNIPPA